MTEKFSCEFQVKMKILNNLKIAIIYYVLEESLSSGMKYCCVILVFFKPLA